MQHWSEHDLDKAVGRLQDRLDQTIRQIAGPEGLAAVARVRELAQTAHAGRPGAMRELAEEFDALIVSEYQRCCAAMLETSGQPRLLDDVPWLRDAIGRRSPFVDALNLLQIDLLSRLRAAAGVATPNADEWAHLIRLTIQGVAAGMRTTG